jgi:hypothetical protein
LNLADFYYAAGPRRSAFIEQFASEKPTKPTDPLGLVLNEVRSRLGYLNDVGLGYLTLDRAHPFAFRRRNRARQSHHLPRHAAREHALRAG